MHDRRHLVLLDGGTQSFPIGEFTLDEGPPDAPLGGDRARELSKTTGRYPARARALQV